MKAGATKLGWADRATGGGGGGGGWVSPAWVLGSN